VTGNQLLSFFKVSPNGTLKTILAQFISNKSVYDITRNLKVEHICDTNKDGLADFILLDQRYAGHNYWILSFSEGFSKKNLEFVDGMRGD